MEKIKLYYYVHGLSELFRPIALEVLSPSLLDLIRSPKRDSVDRLDMVPEMIYRIELHVLALVAYDKLTKLLGPLYDFQVLVIKVVISFGGSTILECPFSVRQPLITNAPGTLVGMSEERKGMECRL